MESLARRMAVASHQVERYRLLNGLVAEMSLRPGEKVKIIAE